MVLQPVRGSCPFHSLKLYTARTPTRRLENNSCSAGKHASRAKSQNTHRKIVTHMQTYLRRCLSQIAWQDLWETSAQNPCTGVSMKSLHKIAERYLCAQSRASVKVLCKRSLGKISAQIFSRSLQKETTRQHLLARSLKEISAQDLCKRSLRKISKRDLRTWSL